MGTWELSIKARSAAEGRCVNSMYSACSRTERKPGFQIGRRNVQFHVAAKRVHHLVGWNVQAVAQGTYFVREGDLKRVECIAGVLDRFRGTQRNDTGLARQPSVKIRNTAHGV